MSETFEQLLDEIRGCRICIDAPKRQPLPHEPRPVLRASTTARLAIFGQAPGTRVHQSGKPFTDPSGDRLRDWMGVSEEVFYDVSRVAIVPMGFCFPGLDKNGGDKPPRRECAEAWRARVMEYLEQLDLALLIGATAQAWHLQLSGKHSVTQIVTNWREILAQSRRPKFLPLPHPSWRNNAWLKANPWFEADLLPVLRREVRRCLKK